MSDKYQDYLRGVLARSEDENMFLWDMIYLLTGHEHSDEVSEEEWRQLEEMIEQMKQEGR
jgi:hypothetical protein